MAIDKPDYMVTMESGPVTVARFNAIQAAIAALPPRVDYMRLRDVLKGADDTDVSTLAVGYTLVKTVAMTMLNDENPVDKTALRIWNDSGVGTTDVQLRISVDAAPEVLIQTWSTTGTTKVWKSQEFADRYGITVEARFYMKTDIAWLAHMDFTRLHGDERREFVYV